MTKIEGKILFEKSRIGSSWILTIVLVGIAIISNYIMPRGFIIDFFDMRSVYTLLLILSSPLVYLIFYLIGFYTAQKRVVFIVDEESNTLLLFVSGIKKIHTDKYKFKSEIRRVGDSFLQIIGNVFFHLEVTDQFGKSYHFFERLDSRDIVGGISAEPARIMNKMIPRTPTRYPSFIHETYKTLEELNK